MDVAKDALQAQHVLDAPQCDHQNFAADVEDNLIRFEVNPDNKSEANQWHGHFQESSSWKVVWSKF